MTEDKEKRRMKNPGPLFIPAGLFIGMGIGWALDHQIQGMFIGLGAGFLAFALISYKLRHEEHES